MRKECMLPLVARNVWILATAASLCACSILPPPPANAPPALSSAEVIGDLGVPHSAVLEAVGVPLVAAASVAPGEPLVTIPYRYKHTAVLTQEVEGFSITVWNAQAPAGAPGFYAGTFSGAGITAPGAPSDLWCFLSGKAGDEDELACFFRNQASIAAIVESMRNPYLPTRFSSPRGTSFDYVKTPIFERKQVQIPGDLKLEYRFDGFSEKGVRLSEFAVGRKVQDFVLPRGTDGALTFATIAGKVTVTPDPSDPKRAAVRLSK